MYSVVNNYINCNHVFVSFLVTKEMGLPQCK